MGFFRFAVVLGPVNGNYFRSRRRLKSSLDASLLNNPFSHDRVVPRARYRLGWNTHMWRKPFLHLTFVILLLSMLTMRELAVVTEPSEDDFISEAHRSLMLVNVDYLGKLSAPLAPIGQALVQLWQQTQILAEWPIENNTAQWEKFYASTAAEKELIEARFHVENAEVYEWSIKSPQKTVRELNRAEGFLDDARPSIDKTPVLASIEQVTREIELMKADTNEKRISQPANYEAVKTDLDHMIHSIRGRSEKQARHVISSQSS